MEDDQHIGLKCSFSGCNVRDYLPFKCSLCLNSYCMEHRSRFVHVCSLNDKYDKFIDDDDNNAKISSYDVKAMLNDVENRFEVSGIHNLAQGSSKEHYNIRDDSAALSSLNHRTSESIDRLERLSKTAKDSRQQELSQKTRIHLLKTHAQGDPDIAYDQRLYLQVKLPNNPSCRDLIVFNDSSCSISTFLHHLARSFPISVFTSEYSSYDNQALVLFSDDTPDWTRWDRSLILGSTFKNFEVIYVTTESIDEIVSIAANIERGKSETNVSQSESVKGAERDDLVSLNSPVELNIKRQLDVGELVLYTPSNCQRRVISSVVAAHLDDFPNVYYTITTQSLSLPNTPKILNEVITEKQTDSSRLMSRDELMLMLPSADKLSGSHHKISLFKTLNALNSNAISDLSSCNSFISFQVAHGSRTYEFTEVDSNTHTIGELKLVLMLLLGVTSIDRMKLICKGKTWNKDTDLFRLGGVESKLLNCGKVTLIYSR